MFKQVPAPSGFFKLLIRSRVEEGGGEVGERQAHEATALQWTLSSHRHQPALPQSSFTWQLGELRAAVSEVLLMHTAECSNVLLNFPRTAQRGHGCPALTQHFPSKLFVRLEGSYKLGSSYFVGEKPCSSLHCIFTS